jgi:uncharacterized SAM-binding protein YcdF (DUF218 family)
MTDGPPLIVLFGAAVWPDGGPSPSLARRIAYAARAAGAVPGATVFCSGAAGRFGPSEASVMAEALRARGVAAERLVLDEASDDTLQTVLAAARFLRAGGYGRCIVCSDRYHLPRIRLLFAALGVRTRAAATAPGHGGAGHRHWTYMRLREALAIPYDLAIVLARRRRLRAEAGAGEPAPAQASQRSELVKNE